MDQIEWINGFASDLKRRRLSVDTIKQYPLYIKKLYEFNHGDLLTVNKGVLVEYLDHLYANEVSLSSARRYIAAISTFYDYLVEEEKIELNPVTPAFKKRYLKESKQHDPSQRRKCLTNEEARLLVKSILDPREKAVITLLLKTGIRSGELSKLNLEDVDLKNLTIRLHPTAKRSNEVVYFDEETAQVLKMWLARREKMNKKGCPALFLNSVGNRLRREATNNLVKKHATVLGLHHPESKNLQDRFTTHCTRHYFTTAMFDAGMPREHVMALRGDSPKDAVDIYNHNEKKLKDSYLDRVPQLGLEKV
jgi:integrase/recombinase XerD